LDQAGSLAGLMGQKGSRLHALMLGAGSIAQILQPCIPCVIEFVVVPDYRACCLCGVAGHDGSLFCGEFVAICRVRTQLSNEAHPATRLPGGEGTRL